MERTDRLNEIRDRVAAEAEARRAIAPARSRGSSRAEAFSQPRVRLGAALAVALAIGFIVWLVVGRTSESTQPQQAQAPAHAVSYQDLQTLARTIGHPVYWAGAERNTSFELTQTSDGRIYIRYLPRGVKVGANKALLTIGTYPVANAFAATQRAAGARGAIRLPFSGGIAFYSASSPTNAYLAHPGSAVQVEVFAPSPALVRSLVTSGGVRPIPAGRTEPRRSVRTVALSSAGLQSIARLLKRPIYWAGQGRGVRYEFRQISDGRIFVRYLPAGVSVGSNKPYLTIGTYPVKDAFAATKRAARRAGAVTIDVGSGAFAFYNKSRPTDIYFATRASNYQVEVFDPTGRRGQYLVKSGQVRPIG